MSGGRVSKAIVVMAGVVVVLTVGNGTAGAQTTPTLKTDASSYATGATVTYTGTGWGGCEHITVTTIDRGNDRVVVGSGISPGGGTFSGTFVARHSPDGFELLATSAQGGCSASTGFFVGPATGQLANTGADVSVLLIGAGIAIAAGWALVVASRRSAT